MKALFIKKCPFCGSSEVFHHSLSITMKYVMCDTCGATSNVVKSIKEAVKLWNRRNTNGK